METEPTQKPISVTVKLWEFVSLRAIEWRCTRGEALDRIVDEWKAAGKAKK